MENLPCMIPINISHERCNELVQDFPIETMENIFFTCDFSQSFWWKLNMECNNDLTLIDLLLDGDKKSQTICFKEAMIT